MPLARAALYAQGENLHVALWPGSVRNTEHITRFIARESRSFVLSVSGLLSRDCIGDVPHADLIYAAAPEQLANGGTCIAAPDGTWLAEPLADEERLIVATCDLQHVHAERQNFDVMGHYARPDVLQLSVNRSRQAAVHFNDTPGTE